MNPKYDIYEEIDRYLNKELSEAELTQFNKKLSDDSAFKSIVEAQKTANEVIIDQEMIKLKARMSKEMNADNTSSGPWGKIIIFSAVVITSAALYTYSNYSSSDAEGVKENSVASTQSHTTIAQPPEKTSTTPVVKSKLSKQTEEANLDAQSDPTHTTPIVEAKKEEAIITKETATTTVTPKEEVKQSFTAAEIARVNCETVHITAEVRVDYGFDSDGEAMIIIDPFSIKGGTAPYSYAIDKSSFDNHTRFSGMKDGVYHVCVKDHNNCISQVKKEIVVRTPVKEIDEAFAPSHGEHWKFPLKAHADATLTIFNKSGVTVYTANISGGSPDEWDGKTNAGVELEFGNYYFVIQYSAREVVKGHISIIK